MAEQILRKGGNAFDAIVASQAVLGLVDAPSNGIGGDAMILVYEAKTGQVHSLNAEGTAPKRATIDWYKKNQDGKLPDSDGLLAGTVPGVVDAWYNLLDRWGTMTFAEVLAPAIEMADNGFPLNDRLASAINGSKKLRKYPTSERTYFPGGKRWATGEIFTNKDLGRTMSALVEAERAASHLGRRAALKAARDRFYKGDIARQMAEFSEKNGGLFRYDDFASYEAKVERPVSVDYRGYAVYKNPSANQGPAELIALNLLEGYELKKLGHNTAEYIHAGVESVKLAFADRDKYLGDELFIKVPWTRLLAKDYAAERRKLIDPELASLEFRPGNVDGVERPIDVNYLPIARDDGDTSYVVVADRDRNVISFTPSLHSGFGTGIVIGNLGFTVNCRGDYFSLVAGHSNALEPGKRPRSTLQSTIILKDGKPFLATGSPGGDDQCMRTMQTFLNIAEFGMNVQQAIEAPRWSTRSFPMSYWPHTMYPGEVTVESRVPVSVQEALKKKGHKLKVGGTWVLGLNAAILFDQTSGVLSAGADPRCDAYALAW